MIWDHHSNLRITPGASNLRPTGRMRPRNFFVRPKLNSEFKEKSVVWPFFLRFLIDCGPNYDKRAGLRPKDQLGLDEPELHGPTNWNLWKIELVSLCEFSRVWWKMKNCILSLALSGQVFWLPWFLIFWLWGALQSEPDEVFSWDMFSKNQKFNSLSKIVSLVEIFQPYKNN
jgi:hypothetical protein